MAVNRRLKLCLVLVAAVAIHLTPAAQRGDSKKTDGRPQRFIVVTKDTADPAALRAEIETAGGTVVRELTEIGTFIVSGPATLKTRIDASAFAEGIASDHILQSGDPGPGKKSVRRALRRPPPPRLLGNPAFTLPGLLWNFDRIFAHEAWPRTLGSPAIRVGVVDTGIDFTHVELASQVVEVVDFTRNENPPICKTMFGVSDEDAADVFFGPPLTDWNGHGTWIAGTIAAALDGNGMNGIAPRVGLVSLKVSQWCERSYDSTILAAIMYAADHGIDVINISFGGYLDLSDRGDRILYKLYANAVRYANHRVLTIVSSAGNDHVKIGAGGKVESRGGLTMPGRPLTDLFGLYQVPGGIHGVIDVSATVNVVNAPSPVCPPGTIGSPTDREGLASCKPESDRHLLFGVGKTDQLAYYSNYGPRIDLAAPGGARKFNLPGWDRGGTPGWPWTLDDGITAWAAFSTSSNWALPIPDELLDFVSTVPCFLIVGPEFSPDQCYSSLQGTSMAAPHVTAAIALLASERPDHRRKPEKLLHELRESANKIRNRTPPLSASDKTAGDLSGIMCTTGYCHLGGSPIPDHEAFGAGLVDARGKHKKDKDHDKDDEDDDSIE